MPTDPDEERRQKSRDRELQAAQELADSILEVKQAQQQAELGLTYNAEFLFEVWRLWIECDRDPFILEFVRSLDDIWILRFMNDYRRGKYGKPRTDSDQ